jgi:hypothetical protein
MNKLFRFIDVPQNGFDIDFATLRTKLLRGRTQIDRNIDPVEIVGDRQRVLSIDVCTK